MQTPRELRVGKLVFPLCERADGRWVSWWKNGTARKLVSAVSLPRLRRKMEQVAIGILNGNLDAAQLDAGDHRAYVAARDALRPYGIAVDLAAREYAAARALLGEVSLQDAARFFQRNAGSEIVEKTTADVILEFIGAKKAQELSASYLEQLGKDLPRFGRSLGPRIIGEIKAAEIECYLDTLGHTTRTPAGEKTFVGASGWRRNQVRNTIATLFIFARDRHYLSAEKQTEAERVVRRKTSSQTSPVYTPAQLRAYLAAIQAHAPEWLPWLAIGAFTGMRTGAILRLDWQDVHWPQKVIEVTARNSKTGRRYLAPMPAALLAWLQPYRKAVGAVAPAHPDVAKITARLSIITGQKWRKNALRASYISYRMATTGDPVAVANECNTSATEVLMHYRDVRTITGEFVTADLAAEWFALLPEQPGKIVPAKFA